MTTQTTTRTNATYTAAASTIPQTAADVGLLLVRLVIAIVFIYHGGQKLFGLFGGHGLEGFAGFLGSLGVPFPTVSAAISAITEFFGGIVLLIGTGTRVAAVPMTINMIVAIATVHYKAFDAQAGGMEYALTLAVTIAALGLIGPGRLTITRLIRALRTDTHMAAATVAHA